MKSPRWFIWLLIPGLIAAASLDATRATAADDEPAAKPGEPPRVITLDRVTVWVTFQDGRQNSSPLRHEYARQAFLMTARHDFGLNTRDVALDELPPAGAPVARFGLTATAGSAEAPNRVNLWKVGDNGPEASLGSWDISRGDIKHYRESVVELHEMAQKQFAGSLQKLGYERRAAKIDPDAAVPDDVRALMNEMNFFSQFQAIRRLHAEMDRRGDADALLLAVSRAYAHLGLLTEHHWHPAHAAFKARAALYAERFRVRHPELPQGYAARGFALALAGSHRQALEDFESAADLRKRLGGEPQPWEKLTVAFLHYDFKGLETPRESELRQLSQVMKCVACEQAGSRMQTESMLKTVFAETEELALCYRLNAMLCDRAGPGIDPEPTDEGARIFADTLYRQTLRQPDLPAKPREYIASRRLDENPGAGGDEYRARRGLIDLLRKCQVTPHAPDTIDEFSYEILASLIAETSFTQVANRLDYLRAMRAFTDVEITALTPLVEGHPLQGIIEGMSRDPDRKLAGFKKLAPAAVQHITFCLEPQELFVIRVYLEFNVNTSRTLLNNIIVGGDATARSLTMIMHVCTPADQAKLAPQLAEVSPHSPWAKAMLLEAADPERYEDRFAEWERDSEQHARLKLALARVYYLLKRLDDAERMYRATIEMTPEHSTFIELGETYLDKREVAKWRATLEESLKHPNEGLNHAHVHYRLARWLMRKRELETALPHAESAARSFSTWGLETAGACYEALGRYEEAEEMFRILSQRYPDKADAWLLFCRRTGFGDSFEARKFLEEDVDERLLEGGHDIHEQIARQHLLLDRPDQAMRILKRRFDMDWNPLIGLVCALTADRHGNTKLRDEVFAIIRQRSHRYRSDDGRPRAEAIELAALLAGDLEKGGNAEFDLKEAEALILKQREVKDRLDAAYILGEYLEIHGKRDEALPYFARCADPIHDCYCQSLAGIRLVDRGLDAKKYSQHIDKSQDVPWFRN